MGQVVPFIARVRDNGDWTAMERARLQELADRLSASGIDVEVIFGATDEGDPWCVVTDGSGDVLIHVARIDGTFVVHSAADDAVNENIDLHAALRDRLEVTEAAVAQESATILPFGLTARQGQTFLALVVAAAFFYETAGVGGAAEAAEPPEAPAEPSPAPAADTDSASQERELATQGATQTQAGAAAPAAVAVVALAHNPAPTAAPREQGVQLAATTAIEPAGPAPATRDAGLTSAATSEAPAVIRGADGDDLIVGTAADEHIIGGAGDDTLRGGGGHDLLEGGAGDDRIELTSGVTAVGGEGADTFVIQEPAQLGRGETLLGVVLDFTAFDKLVTADGQTIQVPPRPTPPVEGGGDFTGQQVDGPDPTPPPPLAPPSEGGGDVGPTQVPVPLTRVDVDLDGDGLFDGYVLVGSGGDGRAIVVPGAAPADGDIFG